MIQTIEKFQRWKIVKGSAIAIFVLLCLVFLVHGINESSMRIAIRLTARTSCILFLLAFCASSLRKLKSDRLTAWLSRNRRYFGLSMAVSHGFHALAIIGTVITSKEAMPIDHGGNLGYFLIIAMSITSFSYPANLIGDLNWKILHTVGVYYLWLAFISSFAKRLPESMLIYLPFVALLTIAIALRTIVPFRSQKNAEI